MHYQIYFINRYPPNAPSAVWQQKIHPVSEVDLVVNLYMNYE